MKFLSEVVDWFNRSSNWSGEDGVVHRVWEHLQISAVSVLAAMVIALPIGLLIGHIGRGGFVAVNLTNIGRAVPTFAILVLAAQIFGIGFKPAFIALVALSVPPLVTNTYTGISEVDPEVREAAKGMGFTGWQLLTRVELPMALPLVMAGIRTSAVQLVATATLAALVGLGGLGRYVVDGLATRNFPEVFAGAFLVAVLSLATELVLGLVQRRVVPVGLGGRAAPDLGEDRAVLPGSAASVT